MGREHEDNEPYPHPNNQGYNTWGDVYAVDGTADNTNEPTDPIDGSAPYEPEA